MTLRFAAFPTIWQLLLLVGILARLGKRLLLLLPRLLPFAKLSITRRRPFPIAAGPSSTPSSSRQIDSSAPMKFRPGLELLAESFWAKASAVMLSLCTVTATVMPLSFSAQRLKATSMAKPQGLTVRRIP